MYVPGPTRHFCGIASSHFGITILPWSPDSSLHKIVLYPHTLVPSSHSENRNAPPTKLPKFTQSLSHSLHPQPCLPFIESSFPVQDSPSLFAAQQEAGDTTGQPSPGSPATLSIHIRSLPCLPACLPASCFFLWLVLLFFLTPAAAATISVRPISTLRPGFPNPSPALTEIRNVVYVFTPSIMSLYLQCRCILVAVVLIIIAGVT
ncbi:hypothetical protein LB506_001000 [Fusarium annulatum]|nr:hypothetical protein LB506_001000 [Fusarium annulatum]